MGIKGGKTLSLCPSLSLFLSFSPSVCLSLSLSPLCLSRMVSAFEHSVYIHLAGKLLVFTLHWGKEININQLNVADEIELMRKNWVNCNSEIFLLRIILAIKERLLQCNPSKYGKIATLNQSPYRPNHFLSFITVQLYGENYNGYSFLKGSSHFLGVYVFYISIWFCFVY